MSALSGFAGVATVLLASAAVLAAVVGTAVYRRRPRGASAAAASRRGALRKLPLHWPLNPRAVANTAERRAWRWLCDTFPDHHIIPKLPLTRFTQPRAAGEGREWFDMLSSAYCSFTLCDADARVVGCVDVLGPQGLSRDNRLLKQTLLSQCGIGYWVMSSESYPHPEAIRAEFLGTPQAEPPAPRTTPAELEAVRNHLHEVLDRGRSQRHARAMAMHLNSGHAPDSADAGITPWPQPDSFLASLDSRTGDLTAR